MWMHKTTERDYDTMKKIQSILALVVALLLFVAPAGALAENEVFTLTLSNPTLEIGEQSYPIDMTLALSMGFESLERAFATLDLYAGSDRAGMALAALENGTLTAFVDGMQYYVSMPFDLEAVLSEAAGSFMSELDANLNDLNFSYDDLDKLVNDDLASITLNEEAVAELSSYVEQYRTGTEDYSPDEGEHTLSCEVYAGVLTLEELLDLLAKVDACVDGYLSDAFIKGFKAGMDASDADVTMEDLLNALKESDVSVTYDFTCRKSDEGFFSFEVGALVSEGETEMPIGLYVEVGTFDPDWLYAAFSLYADIDTETVDFSLYLDNYTDEDGVTYRLMADGSSGEIDADEPDDSFSFTVSNQNNDRQNVFYVNLDWTSDGEPISAALCYTMNYDEAGSTDHAGQLELLLSTEDTGDLYFSVDTLLTLSDMPQDELLSISDIPSINPEEASDEEINAFGEDLSQTLISIAGRLMAAPGLSDLISAMNE